MKRAWIAAVVLSSVLLAPRAGAETVQLQASRDNTLYENPSGSLSNGAGEYFFAGATADGVVRRGLVRFDIAGGVPAGSTITGVVLTLNMSRTRGGVETLALHPLLVDWGEGTSDAPSQEGEGAPATPSDATWVHSFFDTGFWTTPGGDFAATPSASQPVGDVGSYSWGSTAGLMADVQAWLDDPGTNFGWILIGNEIATRTAKRFDSRENALGVNRPQLTVDYVVSAGSGACCLSSGCSEGLTMTECAASGGAYQGDGSTCTPDPCIAPTGACCLPSGCSEGLTMTECAASGGAYQGDGSTCTPDPCIAPTGACCLPSGCSEGLTMTECAASGGAYQGDGSTCTPDPCIAPTGACCLPSGCSEGLTVTECAASGGAYQGDGSTCTPDPCIAPTGACCVGGVCSEGTAAECAGAGGVYQGDGTDCTTDPCGERSEACCLPDLACIVIDERVCNDMGGERMGGGTTCTPGLCAALVGACCLGTECIPDMMKDACEALGGDHKGEGSDCTPDPCVVAPCDASLIAPLTGLSAIKTNGALDVQLSWDRDANANGYNSWYVELKDRLPQANGLGLGNEVAGCLGGPAMGCLHVGGTSEAAGRLLFYNVIGACDGVEAAR